MLGWWQRPFQEINNQTLKVHGMQFENFRFQDRLTAVGLNFSEGPGSSYF